MIFTQTLQDPIYNAIKKEADKKGITVQAQIAYELGEKYGPKAEKTHKK
jgi:hypothetical protein